MIARFAIPLFLFCATAAMLRAVPDFSHQIVPILRENCGKCHTGDERKGGFSMNTRAELLSGSENGKVVVPGKAADSLLIEAVTTADEDLRMPPKGDRLSAEQVALLREWVESGAPWEEGFAFKKPAYEPPLKPREVALPPPSAPDRGHPVDRIIDAYLAGRGAAVPVPISDAEFYRRASLDLVGLLPEPEALVAFARDTAADKRAKLVGSLLGDDIAYTEHWLTFWNDLLRNDYAGTGYIDGGRKQISAWLYRALLENKPYDQFARELVAPGGESEGFARGIKWRGAVSAGQVVPVQYAQSVGQVFLGMNLKCASCHDSFIDRWKLTDAYGLAAIYSGEPLELHRCDKPTGKMAEPAWPFPELGQIDPNKPPNERMAQLADLITHRENGRFARTIVNRLWHRLMGRGIVHPVDAMQSEPWSADLLDFLAAEFARGGYDLKKMLAFICGSQAYQSAAESVEGDGSAPYAYAGPRAKRMTAEQFTDAIWQITGTAPGKPDAPVQRGAAAAAAGGKAGAGSLSAAWIWSNNGTPVAQAGETVALRRRFELPDKPEAAVAAITCDNEYILYVNGRRAAADDNWMDAEAVDLMPFLRQGGNEILAVAKNAGSGPNAASFIFQARLRMPGGDPGPDLRSGPDWQWSAALPGNDGRYPRDPGDWKPAVPLANQGTWASVHGELAAALAGSPIPGRMVRASLMKSDLLMRALGRPNREQIVSTRPNELTTLEAMDLNNGAILADRLRRGAQNLAGREWASPEAFARWLYAQALCRRPTEDELAAVLPALGAKLTPQGIEDVLWAVVMLPEFQLVR